MRESVFSEVTENCSRSCRGRYVIRGEDPFLGPGTGRKNGMVGANPTSSGFILSVFYIIKNLNFYGKPRRTRYLNQEVNTKNSS